MLPLLVTPESSQSYLMELLLSKMILQPELCKLCVQQISSYPSDEIDYHTTLNSLQCLSPLLPSFQGVHFQKHGLTISHDSLLLSF